MSKKMWLGTIAIVSYLAIMAIDLRLNGETRRAQAEQHAAAQRAETIEIASHFLAAINAAYVERGALPETEEQIVNCLAGHDLKLGRYDSPVGLDVWLDQQRAPEEPARGGLNSWRVIYRPLWSADGIYGFELYVHYVMPLEGIFQGWVDDGALVIVERTARKEER